MNHKCKNLPIYTTHEVNRTLSNQALRHKYDFKKPLTTSKILVRSEISLNLKPNAVLARCKRKESQLWNMFLDKSNRDGRFQCRSFR